MDRLWSDAFPGKELGELWRRTSEAKLDKQCFHQISGRNFSIAEFSPESLEILRIVLPDLFIEDGIHQETPVVQEEPDLMNVFLCQPVLAEIAFQKRDQKEFRKL